MTITVALGTSTPTSITVVETRIFVLFCWKRIHGGFLLIGRHFAVQQAHVNVGENDARKVFVHVLRGLHRTGFRFLNHRIDHVGLTPLLDLPGNKLQTFSMQSPETCLVSTGCLPGGSSSIIETSRSP